MKPIVVLIITLIFLLSCNKDEKEMTRTELLCSSNWKLIAAKVDPSAPGQLITISDVFQIMENCYKDDLTKFTADFKFTQNKSTEKCNSTEPITTDGTWSFEAAETKLKLFNYNNTAGTLIFDISEMASGMMKLNYTITNQQDLQTILNCFGLAYYAKSQDPSSIPENCKMTLTFYMN